MKSFLVGIVAVLLVFAGYFVWTSTAHAPSSETGDAPSGGGTGGGEERPVATLTYSNASADDIVVELPFPGAVVGKSFSLIGKARGPWYFEASFPAVVLDKDGTELWRGPVTAEGEWMTEEFVPFRADIVITNENYIGPATIVIHKDNPSGLPERDASISFPIVIEY